MARQAKQIESGENIIPPGLLGLLDELKAAEPSVTGSLQKDARGWAIHGSPLNPGFRYPLGATIREASKELRSLLRRSRGRNGDAQ